MPKKRVTNATNNEVKIPQRVKNDTNNGDGMPQTTSIKCHRQRERMHAIYNEDEMQNAQYNE